MSGRSSLPNIGWNALRRVRSAHARASTVVGAVGYGGEHDGNQEENSEKNKGDHGKQLHLWQACAFCRLWWRLVGAA